jgi:hypothetical protein
MNKVSIAILLVVLAWTLLLGSCTAAHWYAGGNCQGTKNVTGIQYNFNRNK